MSALARELEEARKRAGDAEESAYALRMTLAASERDAAHAHAARRAAEVERDRLRGEFDAKHARLVEVADKMRAARAIIAAVEAALPDCTGDLARDIAGLVATLREHEIALARLREVVDRNTSCEAPNGRYTEEGKLSLDSCGECGDCEMREVLGAQPDPAPQPESLQLCTPEAPEPPHAVGDVDTAPHRVGDIWQCEDGGVCSRVVRVVPPDPARGHFEPQIELAGKGESASHVSWWYGQGLVRVACAAAAPAVGDAVRVRLGDRAAVGRIGRSPTDGTLEAWRVEADDGREVYAREADIERVAVKP